MSVFSSGIYSLLTPDSISHTISGKKCKLRNEGCLIILQFLNSELELHSHDFPVGIHYFVSSLKQEAKRNTGLLKGYHGLMDASFSF